MADSPSDILERDHRSISELFDRVSSPEEDRPSALRELVQRLATHVAVEQAILLPELRHAEARDAALEDGLSRDYHAIGHTLVLVERRKANSPDQPELVNEMLDAFRAHVERCQQRLYPGLDRHLDGGQREDLAARLQAADEVVVPRPHPHLLSLGPASRLMTRIAARLERLRTVNEWGGLFWAPGNEKTSTAGTSTTPPRESSPKRD